MGVLIDLGVNRVARLLAKPERSVFAVAQASLKHDAIVADELAAALNFFGGELDKVLAGSERRFALIRECTDALDRCDIDEMLASRNRLAEQIEHRPLSK